MSSYVRKLIVAKLVSSLAPFTITAILSWCFDAFSSTRLIFEFFIMTPVNRGRLVGDLKSVKYYTFPSFSMYSMVWLPLPRFLGFWGKGLPFSSFCGGGSGLRILNLLTFLSKALVYGFF